VTSGESRAGQSTKESIVPDVRFDILGIGNAMVDVVARVEDSFLSRHDMHKGAMMLIDAAAAESL
jgi:fructokinase